MSSLLLVIGYKMSEAIKKPRTPAQLEALAKAREKSLITRRENAEKKKQKGKTGVTTQVKHGIAWDPEFEEAFQAYINRILSSFASSLADKIIMETGVGYDRCHKITKDHLVSFIEGGEVRTFCIGKNKDGHRCSKAAEKNSVYCKKHKKEVPMLKSKEEEQKEHEEEMATYEEPKNRLW